MRSALASVVLWTAGFWLVLSACTLGVLLYRAAREWYWSHRAMKAYMKRPRDPRVQAVKEEIFRRSR